MSRQTRISTKKSSSLPPTSSFKAPPVIQPKAQKKPDAKLPEWKPGGGGATNPVQRLLSRKAVQAKLTIGEPNDKYEQEADRVARDVVQRINSPGSETLQQDTVQRDSIEETEEELQMKPILQRVRAVGEEDAPSDIEAGINRARGGGQPLDPGLQRSMGQVMGADFSGVRVHTDAQSDQLNKSIQAKAFTTGQDVFFRQGAYQPGSRDGQGLIAHELTHVVQQTGAVARKQEPQPVQSEKSQSKVPSYLQPIFSAQQGDVSLYRKELQDFRQKNSNETLDRYKSNLKESIQRVEITQTAPLQEARLMMRGNNPKKKVSSKAMQRLTKAKEAIKHTKSVFKYGAGNQTKALKATNLNSQIRLLVMRDDQWLLDQAGVDSFWNLTEEVKPIAAANPQALVAAKADLAHGGNCGEHADVAFDYLRVQAVGETIHVSDVDGLDHAFVLMGEEADSDADAVVADPWPTEATATIWEDHFAYKSDPSKINRRKSMIADGQNQKAVIAAGLTLTDIGKQYAEWEYTEEQTQESLDKRKENHFWTHPHAAAKGRHYEYRSR